MLAYCEFDITFQNLHSLYPLHKSYLAKSDYIKNINIIHFPITYKYKLWNGSFYINYCVYFIAAICLRNMAHGYTDKHKSIDDESIANTLFLMSSSI